MTKFQEPIHGNPGLIDIFKQSPISIELYDKRWIFIGR